MKHLFIFCLCLISFNAYTQDSIHLSPRNVIANHIQYLEKNQYNLAQSAKSFNIANPQQAKELALHLKQILTAKAIEIKLNTIPNDPNYTDSITQTQVYVLSDKLKSVFVEKVNGKWYYSEQTVTEIPKLYTLLFPLGANIWSKLLPIYANNKFWILYYWQWLGLVCVIGILILTYYLSRKLIYKLFHFIAVKYISNPYKGEKLLKQLMQIGSLFFSLLVLQLFIPTLFLDNTHVIPIIKGISVIKSIFLFWFLNNLINFILEIVQKYSDKTTNRLDDQLVQVVRKFAKFFLMIFGAFYVLYLLDVNITTIIAGISIGGLAFALAAQDTVKNFIGSIMLFLDRPFNIGDTIKCEQFEGSVLEVGIRSTRIRTLNDSIISIPNGRLADLTIDNKGYRTFKKYKKEFAVSADTPLYVIELYIQSLKDLLAVFPNIKPFSVDIFLADITEAGRMVSIAFTYTIFSNRDEHTQREAILLEILRLSEIMNISLFETSATADNKTVNQKVFLTQDEYQKKISVLVADLKSKQSEPPTGS